MAVSDEDLKRAASPMVGSLTAADGEWIALRGYLDPAEKYPRKIFLTAALDTYVEFERDDVLHVHADPVRDPAAKGAAVYNVVATVFLKKKEYRRVVIRKLDQNQQFVRGQLLDEYLSSAPTGAPVWPEQAYGGGPPSTSTSSPGHHCP